MRLFRALVEAIQAGFTTKISTRNPSRLLLLLFYNLPQLCFENIFQISLLDLGLGFLNSYWIGPCFSKFLLEWALFFPNSYWIGPCFF